MVSSLFLIFIIVSSILYHRLLFPGQYASLYHRRNLYDRERLSCLFRLFLVGHIFPPTVEPFSCYHYINTCRATKRKNVFPLILTSCLRIKRKNSRLDFMNLPSVPCCEEMMIIQRENFTVPIDKRHFSAGNCDKFPITSRSNAPPSRQSPTSPLINEVTLFNLIDFEGSKVKKLTAF